MAKLPPHLIAVQELFRPRMEAQTRRMAELQAMASELEDEQELDLGKCEAFTAEEFLALLADPVLMDAHVAARKRPLS